MAARLGPGPASAMDRAVGASPRQLGIGGIDDRVDFQGL
jgi:hypothetical protein